MSVSSNAEGRFIKSDGSLGEKVSHEWTRLLLNLHLYLHLPSSFGMIVVSILGAMLCGLIISGFMAYADIFKEAFSLRLKGARRLEQADIHNRMRVWGTLFYLMIAITGAYFGLTTIISIVVATAFFDGNKEVVTPAIFGEQPKLDQPLAPAAISKVLDNIKVIASGTTPFYIRVEAVDTPQQYMRVGTQHPGRLIYAEQYRFDTAGNYLNKGFLMGKWAGILSIQYIGFILVILAALR